MSFDRSDHQELSALYIEGAVHPQDQELLVSLLGRLGYQAAFAEPYPTISEQPSAETIAAQLAAIRQHGYRFSDITSPAHVLLREHVTDFADTSDTFTRNAASRALKQLVNAQGRTLFQKNPVPRSRPTLIAAEEPGPMAGIQLVQRLEAGFDSYDDARLEDMDSTIIARNYGIVAGSVVDAYEASIDREPRLTRTVGSFIAALALRLEQQFEQ